MTTGAGAFPTPAGLPGGTAAAPDPNREAARGGGLPWWELLLGVLWLTAILLLRAHGWFEEWENRALDLRFRQRGPVLNRAPVTLVGITDQCLQELGPWPWPRKTHADLVRHLKQAGAKVIAFDILFTEPSPLAEGRDEDDAAFAAAMRDAGNVVLPMAFSHRRRLTADLEEIDGFGLDHCLPLLRRHAAGEGFIDLEHRFTNRDGVIRELLPSRDHEGQAAYALGLMVAARFLGVPLGTDAEGVRVGDRLVPVLRRVVAGKDDGPLATCLLNYAGPRFETDDISYADALAGRHTAEMFRDRAVIVGTRARGMHEDVKFSPFGALAGMEVHANLVWNVLDRRLLARPSPLTNTLYLALAALAYTLFLGLSQGVFATAIAVLLIPGFVLLAVTAFAADVVLEMVPMLVLLGGLLVGVRFAQLLLNLKRSRDDLAKRVRELSLLNEVSKSTSYIGDLDRTLGTVLERAVRGLLAERGSIFLLDTQYESLVETAVVVGSDATAMSALAERFKAGEGIAGEVFGSGVPQLIRDTRRDPSFKTYSDRDRQIRSLICVPLVVKSGPIGVMNIVNKQQGEFDQEDLNLTLTMANQAAVLIDNARLFNLATIDGLTGLVVHRHFQAKLEEEFRRANRYSKPLSMIITDIDHFKKFNDTWGHQVGDMVLREVARIVRNSIRDTDVAARYGGEEFTVILPETDNDGASLFAERLRQKVEAGVFKGPNDTDLRVTISLGVSSIPYNPATSTAHMIRLADEALYQSKRGGRNRVTVSAER